MPEPVTVEELRAAVERRDEADVGARVAQEDLEGLVRRANDAGMPKVHIAAAIGTSRETVRKYCQG